MAVVVQRYQMTALHERQDQLAEEMATVRSDATAKLAMADAQHAVHVRELAERKRDAELCHRGVQAIARSLEAVANSCPGREWPPAWDRIRELAKLRPPGGTDGN